MFTASAPGLGPLSITSPSQVTFNTDNLSSFGLLGPDDREIDLGLHGDVNNVVLPQADTLAERAARWSQSSKKVAPMRGLVPGVSD